jgi:CBS domain-containing protein
MFRRRVIEYASAVDERDWRAAAQLDVAVMITSIDQEERHGAARLVHEQSQRRRNVFMELDCGAAGTPTTSPEVDAPVAQFQVGEIRRRFDEAGSGTLFLDRIELLYPLAQQELFSLMEGRARADVLASPRIITGASHRLLPAARGRLDESLFYRLNVIHLDFSQPRQEEGPSMKVKDLMSTPPQTCRQDTDLGMVTMLMWNHDCGFVPVTDHSGKLVGVITDRDICVAAATRRQVPHEMHAEQAMTRIVHACGANDHVSDALATLKTFKVRRLPVIDDTGRVQGVISMNDIVLASIRKRKPAATEVVSTLAAICAHRVPDAVGA